MAHDKVRDAHCPGVVLDDATYEVDFKPRPKVQVGASASAVARGSGVSRETEFCAGQEDSVPFTFTGAFPRAGAVDLCLTVRSSSVRAALLVHLQRRQAASSDAQKCAKHGHSPPRNGAG